MMASDLLSGAPPARRGAGHPRLDGEPHAARRDAGTREPGGHYPGVSWRSPGPIGWRGVWPVGALCRAGRPDGRDPGTFAP